MVIQKTSEKKVQAMKLVEPRDIIITDPCYIAKDKDWGEGEVFDWETSTINSPIFTDYIWDDTGVGDGSWDTLEVKKRLTEAALMNFIDDYEMALMDADEFPDNDKIQKRLEELENQQEQIGTFCADSGCTGVFLLDEVLKYNPDFQTGLSNSCYTIIKEYTGRITLRKTIEYFHILGIGNITFYTR